MVEHVVIQAEERETGRLEAFSDGVFAVAITLLALDLQVPKLGNAASVGAVAQALARQWPSYIAFATSFFTVLIMWVSHHSIFKLVQKSNARLLFANGLLLMLTTVVPFSTSLVTQYLRSPAAKMACAVYGGTFVLISLAFNLLWYGLLHDRTLLRADASEEVIQRIDRSYRVGTPMYVLATVGAFLNPYVTIGLCTALWIFWAFTARGECEQ
ncbi:MAG TPA: TMEM175 family protein [Candidatus Cybelea sp.]|nr:TMEM175 family protein [Candidatus Cybelea sp.]